MGRKKDKINVTKSCFFQVALRKSVTHHKQKLQLAPYMYIKFEEHKVEVASK